MIWLILCIFLTTSFFIIFKLYRVFGVNTFQAIVFNYITCVCVGLVFSHGIDVHKFTSNLSWLPYGLALGVLFISTFFLMAKTAQEVSVAVSTVASKISMLIPSAVALFLYAEIRETFSWLNALGFAIAILALLFITKKEKQVEIVHVSSNQLLLVLTVFVGTGLVDTVLNVAGKNFGSDEFNKGFPIFCFSVAALGGIIVSLFKKEPLEIKNVLGGIALGIPNYFSIYTLMQGLDYYHGNAAYVYPIVHIFSILLSSLAAFLFFQEKLSKVNYVGVFLAIVAVVLLSLRFNE